MGLELAKYHIADLLKEAEQNRLARQIQKAERSGAIDATGFRERFSRLLSGFPPVRSSGPRTAGA
jgi:hypothetical protein